MSAADLRAELQSGDPGKQSNALLSVLAMLAAGRDVSGLVRCVCTGHRNRKRPVGGQRRVGLVWVNGPAAEEARRER